MVCVGIEASRFDGLAERAIHPGAMPGGTVGMRRRENPALAVVTHLALARQQLGKLRGDRLFALAGLRRE
jgi:hypothetical protein